MNTVDNIEKFGADILHGRKLTFLVLFVMSVDSVLLCWSMVGWDAVLEVVSTLRLPATRLADLFEQVLTTSNHLR